MPSLSLAIDARKAKEGAAEFRRAAKDAADAAGDAAKRTGDLEKGLERTGTRSREASRGTRELSRETRDLSAVEREAEQTARRLATAEERSAEARRRRTDAVRAAVQIERENLTRGPSVSQLPGGARGTEILTSFQTLGGQLGPVGSQLSAFTSQAESAGSAIGGIAGVAGVSSTALIGLGGAFTASAAAVVGSVSANLEFERSLAGLNARLESTAQLEERRQAIYAQGTRTGIPLAELAAGQAVLAQQFGADARAIDLVAVASEKFAKATGTDYVNSARVLASTIDAFRLNAENATQIASSLFQSAKDSRQGFVEYSAALASLGDEARAAGVDFSELSQVLANAASETNTAEATQAVKRFLIAINDETDPATQKLRELGVRFDDLPAGAGRLSTALERIKSATEGRFDLVASIFGGRDVGTVFASIAGDLEQVRNRSAAAREELEKFNSTVQRQQSSAAARFDAFVGAAKDSFKELGGLTLDNYGNANFAALQLGVQLLDRIRGKSEDAAKVVDRLVSGETSATQALIDQTLALGKPKVGVTIEQNTVVASAQKAYDTFAEALLREKPIGFPIDVAIEGQSDEIRKAVENIRREIDNEGLQFNVIGPEFQGQIKTLEEAAKAIDSASKSKAQALSEDTSKSDASRKAIDALVKSLEDERAATGLTARELAALKAQRDAEKIAAAAGLTLKDSEIKKLRDLAQANFDAAEAAKKRTDGEARASAAQAGYKEYVDALKEEVRLLQLSPEERVIDEQVRKAQTLADAYREARRAAGDDPRTVENLVPDQSNSIEQVRALVAEIQRLKALQSESPVDKYGPFIPDTSQTPAAQDVFGPEFDANAAEGQRRLEELQGSLTQERGLLGLSNDERERALFVRDAENAAIQAGVQDHRALAEAMGREFEQFQKMRDLDQLGKDVGASIASGFEEAIFQAKNFNEAINDIGRNIAQLAFRQFVTKPLTDSLGKIFSGFFTGGEGSGSTGGSGGSGGYFARGGVFEDGNAIPFALGGAFYRGAVVPFASGGIFDQPTYFPMSGGRTGLLGEAGPEAIMPLTRGPDGKLGVRSDGIAQAAPVQNNTTHVSMTVVTKDADSFRRSAAQITRDLKKRL